MLRCTRKFNFDAAHRVIGHQGNCRKLHGHGYVLEACFEAEELNHLGMVIDFHDIKALLGKWIDENLDHNVILSRQDQQLADNITQVTDQEIYFLEANPTAENIALHVLNDICPKLFAGHNAYCSMIRLYETENAFIEVFYKKTK